MAISKLKALKKKSIDDRTPQFVEHLVVGNDLFALKALDKLLSTYPKESVRLLAPKAIEVKDLIPDGPGYIRGPKQIEAFKATFPTIDCQAVDELSYFYKDQKFRCFGGRSKPHALLPGESYFVDSRLDFDERDLLTEELEHHLGDHNQFLFFLIQSIHKKKRWLLEMTDGQLIEADQLYWSKNPHEFYQLFHNKSELSEHFVSMCEATKGRWVLTVTMHFKGYLDEKASTVFLPQSQTHEWGHFIADFNPYDPENNFQKVIFRTFIDADSTSSEEVTKKIKGLKSILRRLYPAFRTLKFEEFIVLNDQGPCLNFDEGIYKDNHCQLENLTFLGINAPFLANSHANKNFVDSKDYRVHFIRGEHSLQNINQLK